MFIQKISITVNSPAKKAEVFEEMALLIAYLWKNGQTQGGDKMQFVIENEVACFVHALDEDSPGKKYRNIYVNRQIKEIEELCHSKLKIEIAGAIA